ncbi:MAG: PKD domain-containing protein [Haloarculaceae archaeon]
MNVGETVTLDASTSNTTFVEFDKEGDGTYESGDETDFVENVTYLEAGTYNPQVRDAEGNVAQCGEVVVNAPPSADFTFSPNPGVEGQPVEFDASESADSDGDIVAYHWDWNGDERIDETTEEPVVNETFFETGFRNVGLTVEDDDGSNSTAYRDVEIVEANVIARCSVEPTETVVGQPVTIDTSASENASVYSYEFGDGSGVPETGEEIVTHRYEEPGEYTPIVTVFGPNGRRDTVECPTVTVEAENAPPNATFSFSPDPGIVGELMTFNASDSADPAPDDEVTTYRWDFDGDERFELETGEPVVEHTFDTAGPRNVGLQVEDSAAATDLRYRDVPVARDVVARCSVEPRTVEAGQPVTISAQESENGAYLGYDFDGDGEYERPEATEFVVEHVYEEPGEYTPVVTVYGERGQSDTTECPTVTVEPENEPPEAAFTYSPDPGIASQSMTFDASNSIDPDGSVDLYRWDWNGDGTYDETTTSPQVEHTFLDAGFRNVALEVVDDRNATGFTSRDVEIVEPQLNVRCTVEPSSVEPGENVTIQVTAPNGSYLDYDYDGDGEYDRFETTEFTTTTSYNESGEYTPLVRVYTETGASQVFECDMVTVDQPDEGALPIPPWWPIPAAGGGLFGLGALGYYFFGGGGGSGGAGDRRPTPKPKPRPQGTQEGARYETGVFAVPGDSGLLSVPVGFEPDLILFSAVNGGRTDTATDRSAGWSRGMATRTDEGIENHCLTVADDAHNTDQATCAVDDQSALQLVRHEADGPPGRVTLAVSDTTSDGFEVDVSVPGDDPLAGGIRVLYQAFRTGSDVDVKAGTVMTPTEPGTQTVELGIEADHVSLATTAAVSDTDQLWTTDRGVGYSVGHAVAEPTPESSAGISIEQAVAGSSSWPGTGHPTAGVADDTAALHLLYQDGDRLAGRTSANVTALGETLRLQYDRVYNGPHKLGSTAQHPISYLALSGGEHMRPAVGTLTLPQPGETRSVDCGFEPALIECQIAPAPLGEEVASGATPNPFGASQGTAIATGDRLRQYVMHHAVVPGQPEARTPQMTDATDSQAVATTDGGRSSGPPVDPSETGVDPVDLASAGSPDATSSADEAGGELTDVQPRDPETPADSAVDDETATAPPPAETGDDGRVGLWLATDHDGTIIGRDELRIPGITETGFQARVESVDTDQRGPTGPRPTVVYRAWPALAVTGRERSPGGADQQPSGGQAETRPTAAGQPERMPAETVADSDVTKQAVESERSIEPGRSDSARRNTEGQR